MHLSINMRCPTDIDCCIVHPTTASLYHNNKKTQRSWFFYGTIATYVDNYNECECVAIMTSDIIMISGQVQGVCYVVRVYKT